MRKNFACFCIFYKSRQTRPAGEGGRSQPLSVSLCGGDPLRLPLFILLLQEFDEPEQKKVPAVRHQTGAAGTKRNLANAHR